MPAPVSSIHEQLECSGAVNLTCFPSEPSAIEVKDAEYEKKDHVNDTIFTVPAMKTEQTMWLRANHLCRPLVSATTTLTWSSKKWVWMIGEQHIPVTSFNNACHPTVIKPTVV